MPVSHTLGHIENRVHKFAHILQLRSAQVILGDADIRLDNLPVRSILPSRQSHIFLICIGAFNYNFSGSMSMNCKMHLILNPLVKSR